MRGWQGFLVVVCLMGPVGLNGQPLRGDETSGTGFLLAVSVSELRETVLNPLRHRGPAVRVGVFREGSSPGAIHRISATFSFAALADRYSQDRSSMLFHPSVDVLYARAVGRVGEDWTLYVGGAARYGTRFAFFENWDQGHAYWLTGLEAGLAGAVRRLLPNGNALWLTLDVPVAAAVSRPPERFDYKEVNPDLGWVLRQIHEDMRITSVNEHSGIVARLEYHRPAAGFLRQRLFWETAFVSSRLDGSSPLTTLTHSLGIRHAF